MQQNHQFIRVPASGASIEDAIFNFHINFIKQ